MDRLPGKPEKNAAVTGKQINWPFWHIFDQTRIFSKDLASSVLSIYGAIASYKISDKTNKPTQEKMLP